MFIQLNLYRLLFLIYTKVYKIHIENIFNGVFSPIYREIEMSIENEGRNAIYGLHKTSQTK